MPGEIDKIIRQRITSSLYWKQECYGINAAGLCDKAANLTSVGGLYANQRPLPFLCLVYKLLLISPHREIIEELLDQKYFKYLTALAAVYIRLAFDPVSIYTLLEPKLADYRKLRVINNRGEPELWHIDEFIDALLTSEHLLDLALPRLPPRYKLEDLGLEPRKPLISDDDTENEQ